MTIVKQVLAVGYSLGTGPGLAPTKYGTATVTLERIISVVLGVLSIVAFIYFAIQIIFAGYSFFSAEGDPKKLEAARHSITNGILGIFIIIVAVAITALLGKIAGITNVFDLNGFLQSLNL